MFSWRGLYKKNHLSASPLKKTNLYIVYTKYKEKIHEIETKINSMSFNGTVTQEPSTYYYGVYWRVYTLEVKLVRSTFTGVKKYGSF
jgi:hypothetical protein